MYKINDNDEYIAQNYGITTHTILTDQFIKDNDGNEKIIHKLREELGVREKPDDKFVTKRTITMIDNKGYIEEKEVFIDDKRNVVENK